MNTFLYRADEAVRHCYFLVSGIASVVLPTKEGDSSEVILIGKEGVTGCTQMLGPAVAPTSCFVQLKGAGYRIKYADLNECFHSSEEIRFRILEFVQQELFTVSTLVGCNRLHSATSRFARWLLMAQDRTESPRLDFTQLFLAEMLCVDRSTVSAVASSLHDAGLIDYSSGHLTIVDGEKLKTYACDCYRTTQKLFAGLYQSSCPSISVSSLQKTNVRTK